MKFVFGRPVDEPFDREKEISEIQSMLLRGQSTAVIGVRRIGKTSVLLKTLKLTSGPRIYVSAEGYVEGKSFDLSSFAAYYSSLVISQALSILEPKRRFPLTLKERSRELLRTLRDLLAYLKVTLDVNPVSIEFYFENKMRLGEALREVFELPQLLAQKIGSNFTIAIDEFPYLKLAEQNHPGLFHLLRDAWQFQRNVTYLISGSSVGLLNHMIGSGDQPFYGFFYPVQLRSFSRETSLRFLGEGLREEGVTYERGALEEAVNQLDGIPAWLNLFGLKVRGLRHLDRRGAQRILGQMVRDPSVESLVLQEYSKLSKNSKAVLRHLVESGGAISGITLGRPSTTEGLRTLLQAGFIERVGRGRYRVVDPMVLRVLGGHVSGSEL